MIRVDIQKDVVITLTLGAEEALWLKSLMQNPIGEQGEEEQSRKIRSQLFQELPPFVELEQLASK